MNYYEHHIGDYAEATAHLSFIEDAAYSRLIRKYYAIEKPLPADLKAVQRLVGARSKEEREAVGTVLEEFFTLQDDGWHNRRCDEEIAKYREGDAEREQKAAHEKERMRRHREERSRLFAELRELGITPKWDTPVTQLREILKRTGNAPATRTGAEQERTGNAPATANQTPDTNTQSPIPTTQVCKDTQGGGSPTRAGAVCVALRAEGLSTVNPSHPDLLALLDDGAEIQEFVSAARIAKEKGKGFPYVIGIVKGQRADAQRMAAEAKDKPRQGANHDRHDVEEPA
ncbi:MAG: YdaU family protein [Burkholderiales bacterium]|nr:YdaU family protein [Burkholderiales bacterium]